jgi:hypothetical protein
MQSSGKPNGAGGDDLSHLVIEGPVLLLIVVLYVV